MYVLISALHGRRFDAAYSSQKVASISIGGETMSIRRVRSPTGVIDPCILTGNAFLSYQLLIGTACHGKLSRQMVSLYINVLNRICNNMISSTTHIDKSGYNRCFPPILVVPH